MAPEPPHFDPNELAEWLIQGFKETISYRVKNTFNREKWIEVLKAKIPNKNQVIHHALKRAFKQTGFVFEDIKQGDATFHLIRKKFREVPDGQAVRRFVLVPGFGDTPGSWLASFAFANRELTKRYDEMLILDFPGYSGFLSHHDMVPSMTILLNVVKLVCDANPPSVLFGHSLGGWLAGKVAQGLSKPIEHLILISPSGLIPEMERQSFSDFIVNNQTIPVDELLSMIIHEPKKHHEFIREEIKKFYSQTGVKDFVQSVTHDQFIDASKPFSAKKLTIIWGEHDRFVPAHWLRYWVETYGEYLDAYLLKDTGHIPQVECPRALSQVVIHAIAEKKGDQGTFWKKIQSRKSEFQFNKFLPKDDTQKLIS